MSISTIDPNESGAYSMEVLSEGNVIAENKMTVDFPHDLVSELASFSPSGADDGFCGPDGVVVVPKGWNRIIEKGAIIYISPNKSRIRTYDDMIEYIEADDTCKCGLECPVRPRELFNFDPNVSSKLGIADLESTVRNCNPCKDFDILLSTSLAAKKDGKRRRRGRIKSVITTEDEEGEKLPDRKKILLTGASPLEMFQSGMQAINSASSVSHFKRNSTSEVDQNISTNICSKQNSSQSNKVGSYVGPNVGKLPTTTSNTSNVFTKTLPGGATVSLGGTTNHIVSISLKDDVSSVPLVKTNNVTPTNPLLVNALAFKEQVAHAQTAMTSNQKHVISSLPLNSISKTKSPKHVERKTYLSQSADLRAIASSIINSDSSGNHVTTSKRGSKSSRGSSKKNTKKVLPNVDVKNARELQLSDYIQRAVYSVQQKGIKACTVPTAATPTLKTNNDLVMNHTTQSSMGMNISTSKIPHNSLHNSKSLSSSTSPPPNITVSSSNQLPEALVNQLALKNTSMGNHKTNTHNSLLKQSSSSNPGSPATDTNPILAKNVISNRGSHTRTPPYTNVHPKSPPVSTALLSVPQKLDDGKPIMLVKFVTQISPTGNVTLTKTNTPVVNSCGTAASNLPLAKTKSPSPTSKQQQTVHIPVHPRVATAVARMHQQQNNFPVRYVTPSSTVSNPEQTITVMQYVKPASKQTTTEYVRIAPATQSNSQQVIQSVNIVKSPTSFILSPTQIVRTSPSLLLPVDDQTKVVSKESLPSDTTLLNGRPHLISSPSHITGTPSSLTVLTGATSAGGEE